ncbi:unnamed protein product [Phyllotreta striolata]|uniref:Uncharacterized protein n=1 Tax=Phyllotreta striolata TaxID=444603 RepID=A0A9N9XS59_PHYSR|nr:unnamed protein product [Phyllotreta striolata]
MKLTNILLCEENKWVIRNFNYLRAFKRLIFLSEI